MDRELRDLERQAWSDSNLLPRLIRHLYRSGSRCDYSEEGVRVCRNELRDLGYLDDWTYCLTCRQLFCEDHSPMTAPHLLSKA